MKLNKVPNQHLKLKQHLQLNLGQHKVLALNLGLSKPKMHLHLPKPNLGLHKVFALNLGLKQHLQMKLNNVLNLGLKPKMDKQLQKVGIHLAQTI